MGAAMRGMLGLHASEFVAGAHGRGRAQVARQLEMVYAKDFALIMLERKLARQMGQRTEDELAELNVRIQELTAALDTTLKELAMLQGQVRQAEDNLGAPLHAPAGPSLSWKGERDAPMHLLGAMHSCADAIHCCDHL